jgi:hypothetical protein
MVLYYWVLRNSTSSPSEKPTQNEMLLFLDFIFYEIIMPSSMLSPPSFLPG